MILYPTWPPAPHIRDCKQLKGELLGWRVIYCMVIIRKTLQPQSLKETFKPLGQGSYPVVKWSIVCRWISCSDILSTSTKHSNSSCDQPHATIWLCCVLNTLQQPLHAVLPYHYTNLTAVRMCDGRSPEATRPQEKKVAFLYNAALEFYSSSSLSSAIYTVRTRVHAWLSTR